MLEMKAGRERRATTLPGNGTATGRQKKPKRPEGKRQEKGKWKKGAYGQAGGTSRKQGQRR